jgi:hypothetical protein
MFNFLKNLAMKGLFYESESFFRENIFDLPYSRLKDLFEEKDIQKMKDLGVFILKGEKHLVLIHLKSVKEIEEKLGGFSVLKKEITELVDKVAGRSLEKASDVVVYDGAYDRFIDKLRLWSEKKEDLSPGDIDIFADHQFPLSDLLNFIQS